MSFYEQHPYQSNRPQHLIQYGSQGEDVRVVQQELIVLGYEIGPIDGIFGTKTLAAVKAYQASHGLTVDGIVGPKTWNTLLGIPV